MQGNKREVLVTLTITDPEPHPVEQGLFITRLTHPSLSGELLLMHGQDREPLLKAVAADLKEVDPVSAMFKGIRELTDRA
jgi:hypothetical protein